MDSLQFLDGLTTLQRRLMQIVVSFIENEFKLIEVKEVLRKLAIEDWRMDEFDFEESCEELNSFVSSMESYPHKSVGYIYRVLLRMGQPWHCRYPYFEFHGSVGDLHDDQPSGPEYVQLRLSRFSQIMFPENKPPYLPLSLLNGTTHTDGETNPSHHLGELWMAMEEVHQNPDVTLDSILEIMPGPDFCAGGVICGNEAIRSFYADGKGILTVRGSVETLIEGPSTRIAITSMPQGILIKTIIDQIRKISENQPEFYGFKDYSTQNQVKFVLDASRKWSPNALKEILYRETDLEQRIYFSLSLPQLSSTFENSSLISILQYGAIHCTPAWHKKSGDKTEFVPFLKDILKHGGYKSPLSELGDERKTRILDS
ncbi:MAG: DNA gyrase subunit A [Nitrospiria bacterium]